MAESADYPAAHSMDTTWFAVDSVGHVARLASGEGGAVPLGEFPGDNNTNLVNFDEGPLIAGLLRRRAETDERLAALLPDDDELMVRVAGWLAIQGPGYGAALLAELGLYSYRCFNQIPTPYLRWLPVAQPVDMADVADVHVESAHKLAPAKVEIDFSETDIFQPAEQLPCEFWSSEWRWWTADGRVMATPGNDNPDSTEAADGLWLRDIAERDRRLEDYFDLYQAVEREVEREVAWTGPARGLVRSTPATLCHRPCRTVGQGEPRRRANCCASEGRNNPLCRAIVRADSARPSGSWRPTTSSAA